MKNLVLIGPPGSGKGTQSNILVEKKGYAHVSTGDLLRAEVSKGTELGQRIKSVMDLGELVSDDLVVELLKANIDLSSKQYIFDGFPRNVKQAEVLDQEILNGTAYVAVLLDVDIEKLINRIVNRRVSSDGKHIYNLVSNPPRKTGTCDVTGTHLIQREDDKEEVVRNRMDVYLREVGPMIEFYKNKNLLVTIDAEKEIDGVTEQIMNCIN
ncbi:MAG: adenylate kinase [Halobacteriovoraceae bacterium]|nr:adenylate kinase [Halobacteriovoraceae bacterium]